MGLSAAHGHHALTATTPTKGPNVNKIKELEMNVLATEAAYNHAIATKDAATRAYFSALDAHVEACEALREARKTSAAEASKP